MLAAEEMASTAQQQHALAAGKLRKREDDLVLLIQSYETLRDAHKELQTRVAAANDGSAAHAARLQAEVEALGKSSSASQHEVGVLLAKNEESLQLLRLKPPLTA